MGGTLVIHLLHGMQDGLAILARQGRIFGLLCKKQGYTGEMCVGTRFLIHMGACNYKLA